MLSLHITNETNRLKAVVLGLARNIGDQPSIEDTYDPKSLEHLKAGTYPAEQDMVKEIKAVEEVLKKYNVEVYRPKVIENYNQIFSRDIGFVIEDKFIIANILPDREREIEAISMMYNEEYVTEENVPNVRVLGATLVVKLKPRLPAESIMIRGSDYE